LTIATTMPMKPAITAKVLTSPPRVAGRMARFNGPYLYRAAATDEEYARLLASSDSEDESKAQDHRP